MAVGDKQAAHRPGAFKQQNKAHKSGRHRGRGAQDRENKGRVSAKVLSKKIKKDLSKLDRRHKSNQIRRQRKDAVLSEKRNLGSKDGPPHLVVVVALHARAITANLLDLVRSNEGDILLEDGGSCTFALVCPKQKQRWSFVEANKDDLHSLLDLAKVADTLLFVLDPQEGWDSYGDYCLSCLFAQGLPSYVVAVQGLNEIPIKKKTDVKKQLCKVIEKRFPDAKLFNLDTTQEAALLFRQMATQKQRRLAYRNRRSYILAHKADFQPSDDTGLVGTLKVSGYVRGQELNVNGLIHLVGYGDFQMSQIDAPPDPYPINPHVRKEKAKKRQDVEMEDEPNNTGMEEDVKVLMKADPTAQESLQSEVVPDPMEGEQTWPTEEELKEAEESLKGNVKVQKKVPKGTSNYQAAWFLDDEEIDGEGESEDDDDDDDDDMEDEQEDAMDEAVSEEEEDSAEEESETVTIPDSTRDDKYDENLDEAEEEQMLEKYKEERQDEMFPDEMDTPRDQLARTRFQKYRGLKSFRTSPWDTKENLPRDYARIFQFHDFFRTRKRVFREKEEEKNEAVMVGWYVTVHVSGVPVAVLEHFKQGAPLVLCSLLPHEQKMSVVNMLVRRHPGNTEPVKAKEEIIFHCGFRRFRASPLYSQHTSADKQKSERFLHSDASVVATLYAPITFPPASVLMFKQRNNGMHDLIATGSLLTVDPDRTIIKRIVLSGHPFKIMKKTAVVRYMFFNREDILWFKPVELRTKWGRRGHIKEPLGTHGHMKCHFDGQLKSQDTILMNLYKRVYPKWTYDPHVPHAVTWVKNEAEIDLAEVEMD
ncbi:PREDICTED: pre-rRNA-processing protein TSR1 homolog isoform X1 [Nanorana parkeri]|uniref:pre-rRNA-processing protein TSR1 homolog isoform X1 n=1 Tax=Nanorana parkeri TaxID=125878 RepID=UPI000853F08A|nr:PREDICTED: pre-rRNA-processing protein TSR1 homolog isoform X1 [Nanorana parkeri]